MRAELECYEGSSIAFGDAVFDKRCPDCACFMKWPDKISVVMKGESYHHIEPSPKCNKCKVHKNPNFEGFFDNLIEEIMKCEEI